MLKSSNSYRDFFFYNNQGLKELINKRGIKLSGRVTMERMREALSRTCDGNGTQNTSPLTPQLQATQAILEKSFLPHRKGAFREYTSLGHKLERPILKNWLAVARDESTTPVTGLKLNGAYTAGLAAKKGAEYAKDSIDFVLVVNDPLATDPRELKCWGFEAKGRVTARTAAAEEESIRQMLNPHIRIEDGDVFEEVNEQAERFQVLQHAYVYNLDTVVLAISDNQADLI